MPFAIPLLSVAAAAAGTGLTMASQSAQQDAQNKAISAEMLRQQNYSKQAGSVFDSSLAQSGRTAADSEIAQGVQQASGNYAKYGAVPLGVAAPNIAPQGDKNVVNAVAGNQNKLASQANANMQGYSEWDLQQMIKNMRTNQNLSVISGESKNSESLLPGDLAGASNAGAGLAGLGSIVGGLGKTIGSVWASQPSLQLGGADSANMAENWTGD